MFSEVHSLVALRKVINTADVTDPTAASMLRSKQPSEWADPSPRLLKSERFNMKADREYPSRTGTPMDKLFGEP